jgi:hypothetical protein
LELATRVEPAGVILESAFTSVPDLGAAIYPWLPVRLLSRYRYDNLGRIASVRAPLLVVHSRGDEIVPFRQGQALFAAASEPKRFLELQGGHNDGFLASGAGYRRGLAEFLAGLDARGERRSTAVAGSARRLGVGRSRAVGKGAGIGLAGNVRAGVAPCVMAKAPRSGPGGAWACRG